MTPLIWRDDSRLYELVLIGLLKFHDDTTCPHGFRDPTRGLEPEVCPYCDLGQST